MPVVDWAAIQTSAALPCRYHNGFEVMRDQLEPWATLACAEPERMDPSGNGDVIQGTFEVNAGTLGYMTWVQESNTMRWYDGRIVYTYSACGVQTRDDSQFFA